VVHGERLHLDTTLLPDPFYLLIAQRMRERSEGRSEENGAGEGERSADAVTPVS
jgi:hypothetical protein